MIQSKDELKIYLECDRKQLGIKRKYPRIIGDEIWKYEISLRKYEYWSEKKRNIIVKLMTLYRKLILHYWSVKLGIYIGPNTCGKGLCITHPGCIQINWHAVCGDNLRIQEGVTVGGGPREGAPNIGNNVYLGTGCKIIGGVVIASRVVVGANAVVVHDVLEEGITVAGVPAKKISNNDSSNYIRNYE